MAYHRQQKHKANYQDKPFERKHKKSYTPREDFQGYSVKVDQVTSLSDEKQNNKDQYKKNKDQIRFLTCGSVDDVLRAWPFAIKHLCKDEEISIL